MSNTFLISDTHFGHANILTFTREDGSPLRPGFKNIELHDAVLMDNWNKVVGKNDKVYHLGDVGFKNFNYLKPIFDNLNGEKILIKGNHDNFKLSQYAQIFKDVRGSHVLDRIVMTHIPIHPCSVGRWKGNAHGHLHANKVLRMHDTMDVVIDDSRYMNVCVEHTNYTPIPFEEVRSYFNAR